VKQTADGFEVSREDAFFRSVAAEQLVGCDQPGLTVWKRIADLVPLRFGFIVQQVPGGHLP
jgi:hypothetical protein